MQEFEESRKPQGGQAELSPEEASALQGKRWIWIGGIVIVASVLVRQPLRGPGALGRQWIILTMLGLLAIGIGLGVMISHREWRTLAKAALVGSTLGAIWFLSSLVIPTVHKCSDVAYPNLENAKRMYCQHADGTLLRVSIHNIRTCPDGSRIYDTREERWAGDGWYWAGPGTGCPL